MYSDGGKTASSCRQFNGNDVIRAFYRRLSIVYLPFQLQLFLVKLVLFIYFYFCRDPWCVALAMVLSVILGVQNRLKICLKNIEHFSCHWIDGFFDGGNVVYFVSIALAKPSMLVIYSNP